jgi:hypothetical protein
MEAKDFGEFMGWSLSMHYEQPDNNDNSNLIAPPQGRHYRNFVHQNATYWAAWETWDLPPSKNKLGESIFINFQNNFPSKTAISFLDLESMSTDATSFPKPIFTPNPDAQFTTTLPLTMISMSFLTQSKNHAYVTVLNSGMTSYSFGGWALSPEITPGQRIYRDGEAIRLGTLEPDDIQMIDSRPTLLLYAVWTETTN